MCMSLPDQFDAGETSVPHSEENLTSRRQPYGSRYVDERRAVQMDNIPGESKQRDLVSGTDIGRGGRRHSSEARLGR